MNTKNNQHTITLTLSEQDGTLLFDEGNNAIISMEGYAMMNNIVNASMHMPDSILVNGIAKENPYIIKNDEGEIIEVIANAISFCKFNGGIVSASATVSYNVEVQFTNKLMEVVNFDKTAGHICKHGAEQEGDNTIVRRISDNLDLIANLSSEKVFKAIYEYASDKAMAERKVISIAQRNSLKKLPPFAVTIDNIVGSEGFRTGTVSIILYGLNKSENEISDILAVAKNLNAAIATTDLVEISTGTVTPAIDVTNKQSNAEVVQKDLYSTEAFQIKQLRKEILSYPTQKRNEAGRLLFKDKTFNSLAFDELSILLSLMKKM